MKKLLFVLSILVVTNLAFSQKTNQIQSFTVNGVTFDMIIIDGGTFTMGGTDQYAEEEEKPTHTVTVSDFMIGKFEVTQALWFVVMGDNPSYFKGENLPVERVSWNDCKKFIKKLNKLTGRNFRLPTEAEWEYAARGGAKTSLYNGEDIIIRGSSNAPNLDKLGWYSGNCGQNYTEKAGCDVMRGDKGVAFWDEKQYNDNIGGTHPVGLKQPNAYGLYDMLGNVWEWCEDGPRKYDSKSQINPKGSGSYCVYRGGSWKTPAKRCRVSFRNYYTVKKDSRYIIGFRLAADK